MPASPQEFFKSVLDSFDIDVAIFDAECRYAYVNPQAVRDPAVREWIVGRTDAEYCAYRGKSMAIAERRMARLREVIETGRVVAFEEQLTDAHGRERHFVRRICPVCDGTGRVQMVIGYGYDVTELRSAQRELIQREEERRGTLLALEESASRFRLVARATNDAVWDWNLENDHLWWNDAIETLFGHRRDQIGDHITGWTSNVHPEDAERVVSDIHAAIDGDAQSWQSEYRFRRGDGSYATVLDRGYIIRGPDGKATRMLGSMQDLSERLALESQLRHAQKMEAVGRLAAGVAHDFNNILTSVSAYAELILQELPADSSIRKDVEEIQRAGIRARGLTRQLLAFSRKEVIQPSVLDLNDVVRESEALLRPMMGETVGLRVELPSRPCNVVADRGQLVQVLMNLAINARDAMQERGGELTISTRVCTRHEVDGRVNGDARHFVCLSVRDTGVGMDEDTLRHIFEPFFTTKQLGEGSGLGLATVYGVVSQAGGAVWAESSPGAGSVFHVVLPLVGGVATTTPSNASPAVTARTRNGIVLVVEDEVAVRTSIRRALSRRQFTVLEAGSAEEALATWRDAGSEVDVLVTDIVMPGMRGSELAVQLRQRRPTLAVVFMSGYTADSLPSEELEMPRTLFLAKPFSLDNLGIAIDRLLDETGRV